MRDGTAMQETLLRLRFGCKCIIKCFMGLISIDKKSLVIISLIFCVRKLSLAVEIDGGSHNDKLEYDRQRDSFLNSLGIKIFHTTDFDVLYHLPDVLTELKNFIINNYEHEEG